MTDQAITFDDVLLIPSYNHHESRRVVQTSSMDRLGKLTLELPVISSNMDTITEANMANYMVSKGGVGALHRFMSVEDVAETVYAAYSLSQRSVVEEIIIRPQLGDI